jgi:anti-anti-sigma regulatory factor
MRLNVESSVVGSSTTLLNVAGIIDWSTIAQFQAALARSISYPRPAILVDFTGLLSWSPEAQALLAYATGQARLHGGRLAVAGLAPIPAWQADGCDLRDLDRALEHTAD